MKSFHFKRKRHILCSGYIRQFLSRMDISGIEKIVFIYYVDQIDWPWTFDYVYDYKNTGQHRHCIKNHGTTLICNHNDSRSYCHCFFCSYSLGGMIPNSGKYRIKFKINTIYNRAFANMIGIISQNCNYSDKIKKNKRNDISWFKVFKDYIGWSASGAEDFYGSVPNTINGLYCGSNIFRVNSFTYVSNNENYKNRLPGFKNNDIVTLLYDSDLGILSFGKENDNAKLNAQIYGLPRGNTFYWFVGHFNGRMSLTVIHEQ